MTPSTLQTGKHDHAVRAQASVSDGPAADKARSGIMLDLPGEEEGTWVRWSFPEGETPRRVKNEDSCPAKFRRVLALPSGSVFCWPLWISPEGEPLDLARLELSGRHLLKRGMEESLKTIPLGSGPDRRLVVALAPEEPFPEEILPQDWKLADSYLLTARLKAPAGGCDLLFWKEHGVVRGAFFRQGDPVWCFPAGRGDVAGLIRMASLRLVSEGILPSLPRKISVSGISGEESSRLCALLRQLFPGATCLESRDEQAPSVASLSPLPPEDMLPPQARAAREHAKARERLFTIGTVAALLYLLAILWGAGDLLIRHSALSKLRSELGKLEAPATKARGVSERWTALRSAVDPSTFALDQLAEIAAPTSGGKVRLISVTMENGHLQISGEATDVTQAYSFMESLKKSQILEQYEWTSGQPQLAGKNSVKFEMEGARAHANP